MEILNYYIVINYISLFRNEAFVESCWRWRWVADWTDWAWGRVLWRGGGLPTDKLSTKAGAQTQVVHTLWSVQHSAELRSTSTDTLQWQNTPEKTQTLKQQQQRYDVCVFLWCSCHNWSSKTGASCITLSTQIRHVPGSTFWKCLSGNKSVTSHFGDSF